MTKTKEDLLNRAKELIDQVERNRDVIEQADADYDRRQFRTCKNCRYVEWNEGILHNGKCCHPIVQTASLTKPKGYDRYRFTQIDYQRTINLIIIPDDALCGQDAILFEPRPTPSFLSRLMKGIARFAPGGHRLPY